jgi:competence protein ComEC
MPVWAFATFVVGGLWLCLWRTKIRRWSVVPLAIGAAGAALAPSPDLLVTGDGRHMALVREDGVPLLLRNRSGDFVRDLMSEAAAYDGDPLNLDEHQAGHCTRDACLVDIDRDGRTWRLLAIRTKDRINWVELTRACADADIVVAERWLPKGCIPRWLKLDRAYLAKSGGVAIYLGITPHVTTVDDYVREHPWSFRRPAGQPVT